MILIKSQKYSRFRRVIASFIVVTLSFSMVTITPEAHAQSVGLMLPAPGVMLATSEAFVPPMLSGVIIHPENPFQFDFILDSGNANLAQKELQEESEKLIKYFLVSLTMPEEDLWVNLSPHEKDRIIAEEFGRTEMGKDLLSQDYFLKQLTASLIYPEDDLGKKFWEKVYKKANKLYGTTEIPVNTFNKVWIIPDKALIYENGDRAFVVESHLNVMLEKDYLSMNKSGKKADRKQDEPSVDVSSVSSEIIKEIILPEIEKEINYGKNFSKLRQIYNSFILACWYKKNLKSSILAQSYADQKKVVGLESDDPNVKEKIYEQYLKAFKKGVYDFIKEDYDPSSQQMISRKYFSGGMELKDNAQLTEQAYQPEGPIFRVAGNYAQPLDRAMMTEMALSEREITELESIENLRHWDFRNAAVVTDQELQRKHKEGWPLDQNQSNYKDNQIKVRAELIKLLKDMAIGVIQDKEGFSKRFDDIHAIALTGQKDGKGDAIYKPPTLVLREEIVVKEHVQSIAMSPMFGDKVRSEAMKEYTYTNLLRFIDLTNSKASFEEVKSLIVLVYDDLIRSIQIYASSNHAEYMNLVNTMLRIHGRMGIAHGHLDEFIAMGEEYIDVKAHMRDVIDEANPDRAMMTNERKRSKKVPVKVDTTREFYKWAMRRKGDNLGDTVKQLLRKRRLSGKLSIDAAKYILRLFDIKTGPTAIGQAIKEEGKVAIRFALEHEGETRSQTYPEVIKELGLEGKISQGTVKSIFQAFNIKMNEGVIGLQKMDPIARFRRWASRHEGETFSLPLARLLKYFKMTGVTEKQALPIIREFDIKTNNGRQGRSVQEASKKVAEFGEQHRGETLSKPTRQILKELGLTGKIHPSTAAEILKRDFGVRPNSGRRGGPKKADRAMLTQIIPKVRPSRMTPRQVETEFRGLLDSGIKIKPVGEAKDDPMSLLSSGYTPKHKIQLFDTTYYLTNVRIEGDFKIFVAYVMQKDSKSGKDVIYPRLFYKDYSLVWRSASHYASVDEGEAWYGKGDVAFTLENGEEFYYSMEETTNLPFEIQSAIDAIGRKTKNPVRDEKAISLVVRKAPNSRVEPYQDFVIPRQKASADKKNLVNKGKRIAYFKKKNDPTSLKFVAGFEPDFETGIIEVSTDKSVLYEGKVTKYRILSKNKQVQYQFVVTPNQIWINPPQALTTEIMLYGVRNIDVNADEDLFVPGFDYHYMDDEKTPPEMYSQIPKGYAGKISGIDEYKADASPWLNKLPPVREFKRKVLNKGISKPSFVPVETKDQSMLVEEVVKLDAEFTPEDRRSIAKFRRYIHPDFQHYNFDERSMALVDRVWKKAKEMIRQLQIEGYLSVEDASTMQNNYIGHFIANAVDAISAGKEDVREGEIILRSFVQGGKVHFEVIDNGTGIEEDLLSKIKRGDRPIDSEKRGSRTKAGFHFLGRAGYWLFNAKAFESLGFRFEIDNRTDGQKGAVMDITIPLSKDQSMLVDLGQTLSELKELSNRPVVTVDLFQRISQLGREVLAREEKDEIFNLLLREGIENRWKKLYESINALEAKGFYSESFSAKTANLRASIADVINKHSDGTLSAEDLGMLKRLIHVLYKGLYRHWDMVSRDQDNKDILEDQEAQRLIREIQQYSSELYVMSHQLRWFKFEEEDSVYVPYSLKSTIDNIVVVLDRLRSFPATYSVNHDDAIEDNFGILDNGLALSVGTAIQELLVNAGKASSGGIVSVETHLKEGGDSFEIEIVNDGHLAASKEELFSWFRSFSNASAGMGLPLALQIVKAHGGDMSLAEEDGKVRAKITLPVLKDSAMLSDRQEKSIADAAINLTKQIKATGVKYVIMSGRSAELAKRLFEAAWRRLYGNTDDMPYIHIIESRGEWDKFYEQAVYWAMQPSIKHTLNLGQGNEIVRHLEEGHQVAFVDDVVDTGERLKRIYGMFVEEGFKEPFICAIAAKRKARIPEGTGMMYGSGFLENIREELYLRGVEDDGIARGLESLVNDFSERDGRKRLYASDTNYTVKSIEKMIRESDSDPAMLTKADQEVIESLRGVYHEWDYGETIDQAKDAFKLVGMQGQLIVDENGQGIIITGNSEVGKSYLTAEILKRNKGIKFASDDWLLLSVNNGKVFAGRDPVMHGRTDVGTRVIKYRPKGGDRKTEKYIVDKGQLHPDFVPVRKIVQLSLKDSEIDDSDRTIIRERPSSPNDVFRLIISKLTYPYKKHSGEMNVKLHGISYDGGGFRMEEVLVPELGDKQFSDMERVIASVISDKAMLVEEVIKLDAVLTATDKENILKAREEIRGHSAFPATTSRFDSRLLALVSRAYKKAEEMLDPFIYDDLLTYAEDTTRGDMEGRLGPSIYALLINAAESISSEKSDLRDGEIVLRAFTKDGKLYFQIIDNGPGFKSGEIETLGKTAIRSSKRGETTAAGYDFIGREGIDLHRLFMNFDNLGWDVELGNREDKTGGMVTFAIPLVQGVDSDGGKELTSPKDNVMFTEDEARHGGIDFNPDHLDMETKGTGVNVPIPKDSPDLETIEIKGLVPIIFTITPITDLLMILGEREDPYSLPAEQLTLLKR